MSIVLSEKIRITGDDISISDELRNITEEKLGKLLHDFAKIISSLEVTLCVDVSKHKHHNLHVAKIQVHAPNARVLNAEGEGDDMHIAVEDMIKKIKKQLSGLKERLQEKHA
jgi:putative sigma-54 modulation protein